MFMLLTVEPRKKMTSKQEGQGTKAQGKGAKVIHGAAVG